MPTASMQAPTCSGGRSILTPKASKTSAPPTVPDMARLPCLATVKPEPAAMNAAVVEMLNVPRRSPPVPQVSTMTGARGQICVACARMARAAPMISLTVSPCMRKATSNPPIWAGVAAPSMSCRITASISTSSNDSRATARARAVRMSTAYPAAPRVISRKFFSRCFPSIVRMDSG